MKKPNLNLSLILPAAFRRCRCGLSRAIRLALAPLAFTSLIAAADEVKTIRLGFSTQLFSGINEADARAAVRTLTATISKNKKIPANPDPFITQTIDQAEEALLSGTIDVLGMTIEEYHLLKDKVPFERYLFTAVDGKSEEIFLLVVNKLGTVRKLQDLRGRQLILHAGPRTQLAMPWLDLELTNIQQRDTRHFFSAIEETTKATKAVLPVFFRKADACLITQRSYLTVTEMNPQVGSELQILAQSQPVVPLIIALRPTIPNELKENVVEAFCQLHLTPHGQQGLMIFQTERILERPLSVIEPAFSLLETHARLCPYASAIRIALLNHPREPVTTKP